MAKHMINRSFSVPPRRAYSSDRSGVAGERVALAPEIEAMARTVGVVREFAQKTIDGMGYSLNGLLREEMVPEESKIIIDDDVVEHRAPMPSSPDEAGRILGVKWGDDLPPEMLAKSRVNRMVCSQVVSSIRTWIARQDVALGESKKYVSQGFKRTARDTPPSAGSVMNLSDTGPQHTVLAWTPGEETLLLWTAAYDHWIVFEFGVPEAYRSAQSISRPKVTVGEDGLRFHFTAQETPPMPKFSEEHVIGVDVGKKKAVTLSVVDMEGNLRYSPTTPELIRNLEHDIVSAAAQIRHLHKIKDDAYRHQNFDEYRRTSREIACHRKGLSKKRTMLAQEIGRWVADLSAAWGNACVLVEDLSWIENTMDNGRWNRGQVVDWIKHQVRRNGGITLKVNSANTSKICSDCQSMDHRMIGRDHVCMDCGLILDRDINAAVVIAQRGIGKIKKSIDKRRKKAESDPPSPRKYHTRNKKDHRAKGTPGGHRRDKSGITPKRHARAKRVEVIRSPEEVNNTYPRTEHHVQQRSAGSHASCERRRNRLPSDDGDSNMREHRLC